MHTDFNNWYVLQTKAGRESFIINSISPYVSNNIELKFFTKEVFHFNSGNYKRKEVALFAGYIFVHNDIVLVENLIRKVLSNEYVEVVKFENKPCKVDSNQIKMLLHCANSQGMISLSTGFEENDSVVIIDGPLKDTSCKVLFYNKKKKRASVKFQLFKQELVISLGIDIIKKEDLVTR